MHDLKELKKWFILIIFAILTYWLINNIGLLFGFIGKIFDVLFPFIFGGILAFILNIPMTKIEKFLEKKTKSKRIPIRVISIVLSLLIFIFVILFIAFLLLPELISNIQLLINSLPNLINKVEEFVTNILAKYPDIQVEIERIFNETGNINNILTTVLNYFVNGAIMFISSLVSSIVTLFTGIIFAIYILSQKEYLKRSFKKLMYVYIKNEYVEKIIYVFKLSNKTFSKFVSGQCVEAIILGTIFFMVLSLFRFPYTLIISVLTTITALIPIFGAMIAMVVGAILIAITNPIQAVLFIVIFLIIQQLENNFIYPKVVGKSVGLSPMWTLLAITVGGNLFGIVGMLLGLPLASVIYTLVKKDVNQKIVENNISY